MLHFDAGAITSTLTADEQAKIDAVFITHHHLDHIRDIPTLALGGFGSGKELRVYASPETLDQLAAHLLNGEIYPDFTRLPSIADPRLRLVPLAPGKCVEAEGLRVTPIPVRHVTGSVGYHVKSGDDSGFFYTGDTNGDGLANILRTTSPDTLIEEVTFDDSQRELADLTNHMTPKVLESELLQVSSTGSRLPRVIATHINPLAERQISKELGLVEQRVGTKIEVAYEGMITHIGSNGSSVGGS